jgi:hypothetical protein
LYGWELLRSDVDLGEKHSIEEVKEKKEERGRKRREMN